MIRVTICLLLVLLVFESCKQNKNAKRAEVLRKQTTINNVSVEARFVNRNKNEGYAASDSFLYFSIRFSKPGFDPDPKTIEYLSYKIEDDFKMLNTGDTLPPGIVHRIANGINGSYEYLVAFRQPPAFGQSGDVSILYEDKIFGIGKQQFGFRKQDILSN